MTQAAAILAYLGTGASLTPLDALTRFGCFRLAARIAELRAAGHLIVAERIVTSAGKSIASYRLAR